MKIYKKTIICMLFICAISLILAVSIEFNVFIDLSFIPNNNIGFFENILLGIFASSLLVLIPSIVSYFHEKNQYYFNIYRLSNKLLSNSLENIDHIKDYCQNKDLVKKTLEYIYIYYDELILIYSQFTYFTYYSERDKMIESLVNESTKYILMQEKIVELSMDLEKKNINEETYKKSFNILRKEIIDTYEQRFINYKDFIKIDIKKFINDKKLKTHM